MSFSDLDTPESGDPNVLELSEIFETARERSHLELQSEEILNYCNEGDNIPDLDQISEQAGDNACDESQKPVVAGSTVHNVRIFVNNRIISKQIDSDASSGGSEKSEAESDHDSENSSK